MNIVHTLLGPSTFWIWRNALEICIFSVLFYKLALYLRRDKSKNLLPYFYGYCAVAFIAYFVQLSTLSYFMFIFAPAAVCLFVLFHQETLQRNFVAMKQRVPQQGAFEGSIEVLMRCMLIALNKKQEVSVLIEYNDKLDEFVDCSYTINSPLNHDLLTLLLESPSIDQKKMIWITHAGIIRGINTTWHDSFAHTSPIGATQLLSSRDLNEWYTSKTDSLTLELDPIARTFAVTAHGNTNPQVTSNQVLQIIKKHNLNVSKNHKSSSNNSALTNQASQGSASQGLRPASKQAKKGIIHDQN